MSNGTEVLGQEFLRVIKKADVNATRLAKSFDILAGNVKATPLEVWGACTALALVAIRMIEDRDVANTGFGRKFAADLKALFIANLMTRDKDGQ
jgi:predicted nucleic acid-binding protein